jgi:hypothetical protein
MSSVEVENPLHNVLVVGSCGTLLVLCLIQILLCLILHLCIHLDLLVVHCIGVPGYTVWGYTVVCIVVLWLHIVVLWLCIVVWWWHLVKLRCNFPVIILLAPCKCLKFFLSSVPTFYNPYHHDPLICKNCNMNFLVLSYTSASLDNDMDHAHASYKSRTMVLLLARGLDTPVSKYCTKVGHSFL